jgi:hypothetical protein
MRRTEKDRAEVFHELKIRTIKQRTPRFKWQRCKKCGEDVKHEPMAYVSHKKYMRTNTCRNYGYICRTCAPTKADAYNWYYTG